MPELQSNTFTDADFRKLGMQTFFSLFHRIGAKYEVDEFMEVVNTCELESRYSKDLAHNGHNEITIFNYPELDMGSIPRSYLPGRSESN